MTAYYNENDPFAAAWLRNLIAAGEIPNGEVDVRSIVDVRAADIASFTECHFFAGIGGWPYALGLAGWVGPVWTGSCPCQPLSSAGKRQGHADERHLWPAFYRLIAECRPPTVIGEQVASKDGREWLAGVRADLEHLGYAVGAADLPAAGVGAPHIRQRLFWVAESDGADRRQFRLQPNGRNVPRDAGVTEQPADFGVADATGRAGPAGLPAAEWQEPPNGRATGGLADAERDGRRPDLARRGSQGRAADFWSGAIWLPCLDGKARRVEPGIFPLADGAPARVGRLRAYGNAIVPQAAAAFVKAFMAAR